MRLKRPEIRVQCAEQLRAIRLKRPEIRVQCATQLGGCTEVGPEAIRPEALRVYTEARHSRSK